jgi:hypothetical protein
MRRGPSCDRYGHRAEPKIGPTGCGSSGTLTPAHAPFGVRCAAPHALQLRILECVVKTLPPHRALGTHRLCRRGRCSALGKVRFEPGSSTGGALRPASRHDRDRDRAPTVIDACVSRAAGENAAGFVHAHTSHRACRRGGGQEGRWPGRADRAGVAPTMGNRCCSHHSGAAITHCVGPPSEQRGRSPSSKQTAEPGIGCTWSPQC